MKTSLSCQMVRRWAGVDGSQESAVVARHCVQCPACQSYFAADADLENALRRTAPTAAAVATPPAGFERQIMHAVLASRSTAARPRAIKRSFNRTWLVLGGAAAALALAVVLRFEFPNPPAAGDDRSAATVAMTPEINADENAIDGFTWSRLTTPVKQFAANDPLQSEVDSVYADARSAVSFLALNFLPSSADATNSGRSPSAVPRARNG